MKGSNIASDLVPIKTWVISMGREPITAWRWQKKGWIKTVNIDGRIYISRKEIENFERRAEAGEFLKRSHFSKPEEMKGSL